jgi:hypothetical protein
MTAKWHCQKTRSAYLLAAVRATKTKHAWLAWPYVSAVGHCKEMLVMNWQDHSRVTSWFTMKLGSTIQLKILCHIVYLPNAFSFLNILCYLFILSLSEFHTFAPYFVFLFLRSPLCIFFLFVWRKVSWQKWQIDRFSNVYRQIDYIRLGR